MRGPRFSAAAATGALAAVAVGVAVIVRRSLAGVGRSFRTSSSPGARAYDFAAGVFLGGYYDDVARDCAAALGAIDAPRVLEIGPGPGHVAERLLGRVPDAHWTGLDIDPAMLDVARRKLTRASLADRCAFVEGDVSVLPFADGAFDLVVSSLSAHHWPDASAGFGEIHRVLRPGAIALVYDLPEKWGHVETGSRGIGAAAGVFADRATSRMRGVGPLTVITRVELRRSPGA